MKEQGKTKNLGQIAAIWISSNAPENLQLIWYDTSERVHKVYDTSINEWTALNPQVVTNSTISSLRNIAMQVGLSIGKFFYLTDVGTLAVAITTTKIWYVDSMNNYVVNDLAATITAYINSNNLLIDGSTGIWNNATGRLEFIFSEVETETLQTDNDYIVIRRKNGTAWNWIKAKLSGFVSAVSGNSISWNKGFYFNFTTAINGIKNMVGGVTGYDKYIEDIRDINVSINNISQGNQQILSEAKSYTDENTTTEVFMYKKIGEISNPYDNPPILPGVDTTFGEVFEIIFSWIKVLQNSNRIIIGSGFAVNGRSGNVNYSDTVRTAIEKLVYKINALSKANGIKLPEDFNPDSYSGFPIALDSVSDAIGKITKIIKDLDVWGAEFKDINWQQLVNVGDKIGEFDSQGNPKYTATLEGALYLLSSWYSRHFDNIGENIWKSIYASYTQSTDGGASGEIAKYCEYKVDENSLMLKCSSVTTFRTKIGNNSKNILTDDNTDDVTFTFKQLPDFVLGRLIDKYGLNTPFNIGAFASARDYVDSVSSGYSMCAYDYFANIIMYGVIVRRTNQFDDDDSDYYLKFIPYCTDFIHFNHTAISPGEFTKKVSVSNAKGEFSTNWVDRAISLSGGNYWYAQIHPFLVNISLF